MAQLWFIYSNDKVTGPFTSEIVHQKLATGELAQNSHIWWKGQREWIPLSSWTSSVEKVDKTTEERAVSAVWYVDMGKSPNGPLTEAELIENLKTCKTLGRVRLWAVGMEKWTSLFEVSEIMEVLGLSRRENLRAPLMGTVSVGRGEEGLQGFVLRAASISVEGMGVQGRHDLRIGDEVSLIVKSGEIPWPLQLRGEVAYVTSNGYAGLRFQTVADNQQKMILEYVKKFNPDEAARAAA